jgi:aryl-alcohol dehydrogenase-like predicted oxidoreductase
VLARKAIGRVLPSSNRPMHDWTVERAKRSLDASLRRLGRDHVELYMLHEPDWASVRSDEWLRWLDDEVAGGRVGHFGIAGEAERVAPFLTHSSRLAALVQTTDSIDRREADLLLRHARPLQITYGYVSAAMSRNKDAAAEDILKQALDRNKDGAVIVTTRRPERMRQYAALDAAP